MGHLRDLPKSKMGVDIEHGFEPKYIPVRDKKELIDQLKKDSKAAKTVYLATDPDREGEAISWHLKELLDLPDEKARRVTFNEITKRSSLRASSTRAISIRIWSTRSRRAAYSTASSATSCRRCCGKGQERPVRGARAVCRNAHGR